MRQTENYIKYADELKDLKGHKEAKRAARKNSVSEKAMEGVERKQAEVAERISTIEARFGTLDKDIRQSFQDFESKYVTQQLDLTQSL